MTIIQSPSIRGKIPYKPLSLQENTRTSPVNIALKPDQVSFSGSPTLEDDVKTITTVLNRCIDFIENAETDYDNIKDIKIFENEISNSDRPEVVKAKILKVSADSINDFITEIPRLNYKLESQHKPPVSFDYDRCAKALLSIITVDPHKKGNDELDNIYERAQTLASYALGHMEKENLSAQLRKGIPDIAVKVLSRPDTSTYTAESLFKTAWFDFASQDDPDFKALKDLTYTYKYNSSREPGKAEQLHSDILNQEEKILARELLHPGEYATSALLSTYVGEIPSSRQEQIQLVRKNALGALQQLHLVAKSMKLPKDPNKYMPVLTDILSKPDFSAPLSSEIEYNALSLLNACYKDLSSKNKNTAEVLALKTYYNSPNMDSRREAFRLFEYRVPTSSPRYKHLENHLIESFKKLPISEKHTELINLGKLESKELEKIIPQLLTNEKLPFQLKRAGAWGAGLSINDTNFKNLVRFLTGVRETPQSSVVEKNQLVEMALSSLSEYAKNDRYKEPATRLIQGFLNEEGHISLVANDLLEKVNKMDEKPNFYISKVFGQDKAAAKKYIDLRNKFIPTIYDLDTQNRNYIDKALLPFWKMLPELIKNDVKIIFSDSKPVTFMDKDTSGRRSDDGRFDDFVMGMCYGTEKIVLDEIFSKTGLYNTFAHEFGHMVDHTYVLDESKSGNARKKIAKLYNAVTKPENMKERCLNSYAATSRGEYFADGVEAFTSITKPHHELIRNMDFEEDHSCTLSTLLNKDPDLYNFIYDLTTNLGNNTEEGRIKTSESPIKKGFLGGLFG